MKVDNFKKIEKLLFDKLDEETTAKTDMVVLGRIIRRKKENPDKQSEFIVKRYTFSTKEKFIEYQEEIKQLCHLFNARFYVGVNIKSMKDIAFDIAEKIPEILRTEQYYFIRRIFDNMADSNTGVKDHRLWVFDIDDKSYISPIMEYLSKNKVKMNKQETNLDELIVDIIPTINGSHLIMKPHDTRYLKDDIVINNETFKLKDICDVKKKAMTLVYYSNEE